MWNFASCTNIHLIRQSHLSCWDTGEMGKLVARTQNPAPNPAPLQGYLPSQEASKKTCVQRKGQGEEPLKALAPNFNAGP